MSQKNRIGTFIVVASLALIGACGKKNPGKPEESRNPAGGQGNPTELEGFWAGNCRAMNADGFKSRRTNYEFRGNRAAETLYKFTTENCAMPSDTGSTSISTNTYTIAIGGLDNMQSTNKQLTWTDNNSRVATTDIFRIYTAPGVPNELYFGDYTQGRSEEDPRPSALNFESKFIAVQSAPISNAPSSGPSMPPAAQ